MGGSAETATYQQVASGRTGHAETIAVHYDPTELSYETLLEVFFATHNPTTKNQQGADIGSQYRSTVFIQSEEERAQVEQAIEKAQPSYKTPIVTTIEEGATFYPAEPSHKEYYKKNQGAPYCQVVIGPKIRKLLDTYGDLVG